MARTFSEHQETNTNDEHVFEGVGAAITKPEEQGPTVLKPWAVLANFIRLHRDELRTP